MDTISNMIISIKNAGFSGHESTSTPYSKLKQSIAEVLKKEGFIKNFEEKSEKGKKVLYIELFLENRVPKIKGVKRISKPSKRIYQKASEIRLVKSGYGALVISTPSGVMSGREARKAKLGGEALFTIW
ncbi:MAG: 30S ribosomal protein S8 [Candidatus Zambryskibacteria bacterium RIFCSPHIGHO2_01_FULL_44_22b]|uniref:Small ribosomal subunit protein uS8 n=2 Tax=Candidatus Zambryskiibacteriota TaxID=1817925 RepID=A0A1G2SYL5_9BACT|nr:MAG: 30S ribosomal protein S8 [Candidatus Zambryskibacteria bacterium RIFCSPHIGHO2_01_FULL_44_22b]OHB05552.1 MAG: 30S ribosomal protein S8 [Candidatus Zambryskibacteria bacterium RIFCSPLOWO2_01_FULL_45_43]